MCFGPARKRWPTGDPTYGLDVATSRDFGASWSVNPTVVAHGQSAFSSVPAAAVTEETDTPTYLQAWAGADSTVVHTGFDPSVPPVGGYGRGYDQALVVGRGAGLNNSEAIVAWCNDPGGDVSVRGVDPSSGSPIGDALALPDTGRCPASTRVPLAAFPYTPQPPGGHAPFYAAADSADGRHVLVYTIVQRKIAAVQTVAVGSSFKQQVAMTQNFGDRIWVGWKDSGTGDLMFRRSSPVFKATGFNPHVVFGAPVSVTLPKGQTIDQLAINGETTLNDRLFAVATTSDDNNVVSMFVTLVRPGLTLKAGTRAYIAKTGFRVLDAGDPVRGATVTVRRRALTTNDQGYAKTRLAKGSYKVTASKSGYHSTTVRIRLR